MSFTIDVLRGRAAVVLTCDACGHPILSAPRLSQPYGIRDYERITHGVCPDDDAPRVGLDTRGARVHNRAGGVPSHLHENPAVDARRPCSDMPAKSKTFRRGGGSSGGRKR